MVILPLLTLLATLATPGNGDGKAAKKSTTPPKDKPQTEDTKPKEKEPAIRPGSIQATDLKEYDTLDPKRKALVDAALKLSATGPWLHYVYGSSDPSTGGLDCSGSMYYLMQQVGIDPPRTSGDLFRWVKEANRLTEVPATASSLDDAVFNQLTPGDLLFWSGTTGGDDATVSHVQMFLGHEKSDGLAVMAGSSDGRSYRGKRRDGYGVFDFKLPSASGGKGRFLGYGPPPTFGKGTPVPAAIVKNDGDGDAEKPAAASKSHKSATARKKQSSSDDDDDAKAKPAAKKKPSTTPSTSKKKKKKADD